jgi:hypothetical protein
MSSRTAKGRVGILRPYLVTRFGEKIPTRAARVRDDNGSLTRPHNSWYSTGLPAAERSYRDRSRFD